MGFDIVIHVREEPDDALVQRLSHEISAFNFATTDIHDGRVMLAAVDDAQGELVAGVYGWTWGQAAWIEQLWVRSNDRGRGVGSALLTAIEREARARGCSQVGLTTHSFQAPDFYRRHGFEAVGEISGYPLGHSFFLMRKPLD